MLLTGRLICSVEDVTLHISTCANQVIPAKLVNAGVKYGSDVGPRDTKRVQSIRSVCTDAEFARLVLGYPELAVSNAVLYYPPFIRVIVVGRGFQTRS